MTEAHHGMGGGRRDLCSGRQARSERVLAVYVRSVGAIPFPALRDILYLNSQRKQAVRILGVEPLSALLKEKPPFDMMVAQHHANGSNQFI